MRRLLCSFNAALLYGRNFFPKKPAFHESGVRVGAKTLLTPGNVVKNATPSVKRLKDTELPSRKVIKMSVCPSIDEKTIRLRCELIRSRWDPKTAAERRATAIALQRELAQQLGLGFKPTKSSHERPSPSMFGAA
jgi:hypothetical protein